MTTTMQASELVSQFFNEAINEKKVEVLDTLLHQAFHSHHYPAPPGSDKTGFIQGIHDLLAAFPDIQITVHELFGKGNKAFTYFSWNGTHKGNFNGIAPTNKKVTVEGMDIWREEDGQIIENWVIMDVMGLMVQLGVVPPPQ